MNYVSYVHFVYLFLSFSLLVIPLPLSATAENLVEDPYIFQCDNADSYVYLGQDASNIATIIEEINNLDDNSFSLLRELNEHIKNGFDCAEYDAVIETLEYAETVLQSNYKKLDPMYFEQLATRLKLAIKQLLSGSLAIDAKSHNACASKRILVIDENIDVLGKAVLRKHVKAKQGISVSGKLKVGKSALFKSHVTVQGNLAAADVTLQTLSVNDVLLADTLSVSDGVINGCLTVLGFTPAGVVHNNEAGLLSSALIVNDDIAPATIANSSLATISSADIAGDIVVRDGSGNFSTHMITIDGTTTNPTDAATKAYVDAQVGGGGISLNIPNSLVKRDDTGSFAAQVVSMTDGVVNSMLTVTSLNTPGVVHNSAAGLLTSSLIVNADITPETIANSSLATITNTNAPGYIVVRDDFGNFATNGITITGVITNPTDAATKAYVDAAVTGIIAKTPAVVVSITDIGSPPDGLQTIDGVTLNANDRVLLAGQTNQVENGLWLAQSGDWTRPADFANGSIAGEAYVLILSGTIEGGSSWLCNTPTAIIDTDNVDFVLFSLPNETNGANVGTGTGLIYQGKTGTTLNFKTLLEGDSYTIITNDANDVAIGTNATNTDTAGTIVARDANGNFAAGTIVASLTGAASLNVLKAGDTMTGTLQLPAGTTALPSLVFTGSTTTGLSAHSGNLSLSTSGIQAMAINSAGVVSIDSFILAGVVHNDDSSNLSSSLIVDADVAANAAIVDTKLATINTADKVANSATTATSANTENAIVARDSSGNFSAGTIVASLNGNATTATTATNFIGSLAGDVTGTQGATVVSFVGGQTAATVAAATVLVDAATNLNTANAFVKRDGTGSFAAQVISMTDGVHSGNLVLSTEPSTSTAGNILKGSSRFIHDFGTNNIFVGINAGNFITSGSGQNSAFGVNALMANTTGVSNVALGYQALIANTVGSNNIAIGPQAGKTITTGSDNIYINADAAIASESSTTRIGTSQTSCYIAGINTVGVAGDGVVVGSDGQLGITLSSNRFKHDIEDMGNQSADILALRPVTFVYNGDETNTTQYGLIAEEVEELFPAIVARDENGMPYTVRYHILPVLLLNELQKQHMTIEAMKKNYVTVEEMRTEIDYLHAEIKELVEKIKALKPSI